MCMTPNGHSCRPRVTNNIRLITRIHKRQKSNGNTSLQLVRPVYLIMHQVKPGLPILCYHISVLKRSGIISGIPANFQGSQHGKLIIIISCSQVSESVQAEVATTCTNSSSSQPTCNEEIKHDVCRYDH